MILQRWDDQAKLADFRQHLTQEQCEEAITTLEDLMRHPGIPLVCGYLTLLARSAGESALNEPLDSVDLYRGAVHAHDMDLRCLMPSVEDAQSGNYETTVIKFYRAELEALRANAEAAAEDAGGDA
jgi:hypothetical protein